MRSVLLAFSIVFAISAESYVSAKEPNVVMGFGSHPCRMVVSASKQSSGAILVDAAFAWVQGWISARNLHPRIEPMKTVGGSLSANTLESMFVDQCKQNEEFKIYEAADALYDYLESKQM
jgi:hypothetical protein